MSDDGINEMFPGPPQRPDVPEFWHLSEIVLKHDADAAADGGLEKLIESFIPEEVAGYMAVQRSLYFLLLSPEHALMRMINPSKFLHLHMTIAASWSDGFCAGAAYQKKYGEKVSE